MSIELHLNQQILALRVIERALHSPEGWSFRVGGCTEHVQVITSPDAVALWGTLDPGGAEILHVEVYHDDDLLLVRPLEVPDPERKVEIEWVFALEHYVDR